MTAKTVSKTDSKFNVKLIAITAMCAALVTVTTAFIKIPSPLGYSHAGDSMIYLAASILPDLSELSHHQSAALLPTLFRVIRIGQSQQLLSRLSTQFRLCFAEWQ